MTKDLNVKRLFDNVAFSYDFQNSFLSLRRDVSWRRILAEAIETRGEALILDAATGTAEVAIEISKRRPRSRIIGLDFSPRMLEIGRKKVRATELEGRIRLFTGDGRCLPFVDASFDAVTIAFGIRNIPERQQALAEFSRVLKPGGQLLVMEFDYPDDPVLGFFYRLYFDHILPPIGNWLAKSPNAYTYFVESVKAFPDSATFLSEIASAGFSRLGVRKLTYGIAKIYSGFKDKERANSILEKSAT